MLWVNKDVEAEQVPIESPDITAAIIRLPGRLVFVTLVYVLGEDAQALRDICTHLRKAIVDTKRNASIVEEVVIAGDFNRHDQLWGGDEVSIERQGEADPIIDLMNELALSSLLRRGTKIWHGGSYATTIDLVLATEELLALTIRCAIHGIEHGSDHCAIETIFDVSVPTPRPQERLLLKNAPWKEINARITRALDTTPSGGAPYSSIRID